MIKPVQQNLLISMDWLSIGAVVLRKKRSLSRKVFMSFFRLSPALVEKVYQRVKWVTETKLQRKHLLWTLFFLKSADPLVEHIAATLGI